MKIAVFGATGMVGREVVTEARSRGHEVVTVSTRPGAADVAADLADTEAAARVGQDVDAIVVSVPPARDGASHEPWVRANERLADTDLGARVLFVGGAGSSEVDGVAIMDQPGFPAEYLAEARSAATVLEYLRRPETKADWTYLSPAPALAPGERTGAYRSGSDEVVGDSISSQDLAIAVVDELETGAHRRARFTVAS